MTAGPGDTRPRPAYITMSAQTRGTALYLDNRSLGTDRVVRHPVTEGLHRIEAIAPGGARISKWLVVEAGDDRLLELFL